MKLGAPANLEGQGRCAARERPTSEHEVRGGCLRALVQAARNALPPSCTDRLPEVTPSSGPKAVSAARTCTRSMARPSSSAAICAERRADALAELDLAGAHLHRAVGGEESVSRQESYAARCTARTMRLCAPQRHVPSSARRTSASVGDGVWRNSAAAAISMPELQ